MKDPLEGVKCEVCGEEPAVGVYSVPGVPMSCAYGQKCIDADVHPLGVLIANVVCCGGYDRVADWVKADVERTVKYLGKTMDEFHQAVKVGIEQMDKDLGGPSSDT